jgi:alkanesulfonate monooxygenase SsuD/methylene tetrahydromethanopterin reductase-like flavin-dependent oxidoreductase (luciferase family)
VTEHVKLAEQIGFRNAWFAEHHFSNYCLCPSPLTMCAYMAPQTKNTAWPAVVVAPLYEPVRLLEDICMVDQLSGGRWFLVQRRLPGYEFLSSASTSRRGPSSGDARSARRF